MKKIILSLVVVFALNSKAQIKVDDVDINALPIDYCQIVGVNKGLINKRLVVFVDYGQSKSLGEDTSIKDKDGKTLIFNSTIDALNFFEKNGWEYKESYMISYPNSGVYQHFILKRKK